MPSLPMPKPNPKAKPKVEPRDENGMTAAEVRELRQARDDAEWRKKVDKAPTTKTTMGEMASGGSVRGCGKAARGFTKGKMC